jgi:hypothetical protein
MALLRLRTAGQNTLPLVAQLGRTEPTATDDCGGADAQTAVREHRHLLAASRHQCGQRIDQRQDPMGEIHGAWIRNNRTLFTPSTFTVAGLTWLLKLTK